MSPNTKRITWPIILMVITLLGALVLIAGRTRNLLHLEKKPVNPSIENPSAQDQKVKAKGPSPRNLSLQPEAFNMGRRLGQRFAAATRERSILVGTLTIGSYRRVIQTTRTQTDNGEQVEIAFIDTTGSLTWDASRGAFSVGVEATGSERELIERLVFDSPDQFVLAQLRGASYYTIAYNARPSGAGKNYAGPLWNIVRVNDPATDEVKRPQSRWRLYYINAGTELIDRIESEVQGQRISAEMTWSEVNGERVPSQITWTRQGQTLMEFSLSNFSHLEN